MVIQIRQGTAEDGGFIINKNTHITKRELDALALIGMGLDNQEVAKNLGVSVNTVRNHIWNVMQKLGATSRANAIVLAMQNGIFEVMPKRTLDTFVRGVDQYVLCIMCGRAALREEYGDFRTEKVTINHVEHERPIFPACPTEGCKGDITETIEWDVVREHHPEYPEIPEYGISYDYEIEWYRDYPLE